MAGHVMNAIRANMQVVLDKNNQAWIQLGQEHVANKISNVDRSNLPVGVQGCIDSGCRTHCAGDCVMVTGKLPVLHGIFVGHPDSTTTISTHTSYFHLYQTSLSARRAHILPPMKDCWFIPVVKLCDIGFSVNFNTNNVFLLKINDFLTIYRYSATGIYLIDFDKPQPLPPISNLVFLSPPTTSPSSSNTLSNSLHEMSTKRDLVLYVHRSSRILVPSTWIQAIYSGFYATWTGLTSDIIRKHLPKSIHTYKWHLFQ